MSNSPRCTGQFVYNIPAVRVLIGRYPCKTFNTLFDHNLRLARQNIRRHSENSVHQASRRVIRGRVFTNEEGERKPVRRQNYRSWGFLFSK